MTVESYSVPKAAELLLLEGILHNPLVCHNIPTDAAALAKYMKFSGNNKPSVPIDWRFAESISALKDLESLWPNALLKAKYGHELVQVNINTDHATLFFMSCLVLDVVGKYGKTENPNLSPMQRALSVFPMNWGESRVYRGAATNISKTKDGRFYHVHGSMNAVPSVTALDLPLTAALRPGLTDGSGAVGNSNRALDSHCEYGRY